MSLLSEQFHIRWLATPQSVRKDLENTLKSVVELLEPSTDLAQWKKKYTEKNSDDAITEVAAPEEKVVSTSQETKSENLPNSVNAVTFEISPFLRDVTANTDFDLQNNNQSIADSVDSIEQIQQALDQDFLFSDVMHSLDDNVELEAYDLANHLIRRPREKQDVDVYLSTLENQLDEYLAMRVETLKKETLALITDHITAS